MWGSLFDLIKGSWMDWRLSSQNTTPVASFWYSWSFYGYFGLWRWPHKTILRNLSTCHMCFDFIGKKTHTYTRYGHLCVPKCPCMDWNTKKIPHKLWSFVSKCPCMDCSFLYNTTSVPSFLVQLVILWLFCFMCSHRELGAVSIRKTVLPGMAIPMLKIRRPNGRLIFNMEITIRR